MWPFVWFVAGIYTAERCPTVTDFTVQHVDRIVAAVREWVEKK